MNQILNDFSGDFIGIKETSELVLFATRLANSIDNSLKDGKIGVTDLPNLWEPIRAVKDAFEGIKLVPSELVDLNEAEEAELVALVKEELALSDERAEVVTEEALRLAFCIAQFITVLRKLRETDETPT